MRRFSQRNALVTLSEINITPLLDLAFVLLIIFVITTPLLEKGLELHLPKVDGQTDTQVRKEDVRTVEINPQGYYFMLKAARRYVIVIAFVLGAVLTTPEVITQVLMAIPLLVLYEISVWIAWYWERKERRSESESGA